MLKRGWSGRVVFLGLALDFNWVDSKPRGLGDRGYRWWLRVYGWELDLLEFPAAAAEQDYAGCGDGCFGDYDGDEDAVGVQVRWDG